MDRKLYGYALLFSALLVTSVTPMAYVLGNGINPIALMLLVSVAGTAISFSIAYAKGTLKHVKTYFTTRSGIYAILSFSLLLYVVLSLIFSYVTHYVSADLVAVIYRSWPLMLIPMAPFLMHERMTKYDALGVVIGFSSLAVTLVGGTSISIPAQYLPFVLLLLLGAFLDAFGSGVSKRYNYELTSSVFAYNAVALAVFLPLAFFSGSMTFSGFTAQTALAVMILGAVQNVLLSFLFVASFRRVKTSIASNVLIASPFFTMLLSALFLNTPVEPYYVVIAAGVALGIIIQHMQPRSTNYVSKDRNMTIFDVTSAFVDSKSEMIYNGIKGECRALAFFIDTKEFGNDVSPSWLSYSGEDCFVFTDKKPHREVAKQEIDFIRSILGSDESKTVVIGIGKPLAVEQKFAEFKERLGAQESSSGKLVPS